MNIATMALVLFGVFAVLPIPGCPISINIVISSTATTLTNLSWDQTSFIVMQKVNSDVKSFSPLAVPLFILVGNIMDNGGITRRLTSFVQLLFGRIPGSLAHANVLANMFFRTLSSSAVAAVSAIDGTMDPMEKENGYDPAFSTCVNIASVSTGLLVPPTSAFIVYSMVTDNVSVSVLFMVGYVSGVLTGVATMLIAYFYAKKHEYPVCEEVSASWAMKITLDALPSLLLIMVVVDGAVGGIFTMTEGTGIYVLYCLILPLVCRSVDWKSFMNILLKSVAASGIILFLISAPSTTSWAMTYTGTPEAIGNAIVSISSSRYVILLMVNPVLLAVGMSLDITPACSIFTPVFLPTTQSLGMNLMQFGVVLTFNMCMGTIISSASSVLFVPCGISKVSIEEVVKPLLPCMGVLLLVLLLVTCIPEISLTLPRLMGLA